MKGAEVREERLKGGREKGNAVVVEGRGGAVLVGARGTLIGAEVVKAKLP